MKRIGWLLLVLIPVTITYEFYDFGTPVTVTIPPSDQVHPIGNG